MKVNSEMVNLRVKENINMEMVIGMMVIGLMGRRKVKVNFIIIPKRIIIKVCGEKIRKTDKVDMSMEMVMFMKESLVKIRNKEEVFSSGKKVNYMMDNFLMINYMVMVLSKLMVKREIFNL